MAVLESVLGRLILEPDFQERFFFDAPGALEEYELSSIEEERLRSLTRRQFHREIGTLVTHFLIPIDVADSFIILPASHSQAEPPGKTPILLSPGWAFGNGSHATTELCLSALSRYLHPGDAFLDIGTGTGILSIAAARLGAGEARAYDIDSEAVELARKNMALNGMENIVQVEVGTVHDALQIRPQGWDLVAVNILGSVFMDLLESGLARTLKMNGILIGTAIKAQELGSVLAKIHHQGLKPIEQCQKHGWNSVIAMKGDVHVYRLGETNHRASRDRSLF